MNRWKLVIWSAASLFVVGVVFVAHMLYHVKTVTVPNAYAVWWVADMIVEHMEANHGAWPRDWDDLRDDYATCVKRSGDPWTFDELQARVTVDWTANPEQLANAPIQDGSPPFHVIRVRDGEDTYWSGREPNRLILDYLNGRLPPAR